VQTRAHGALAVSCVAQAIPRVAAFNIEAGRLRPRCFGETITVGAFDQPVRHGATTQTP